VSKLGRKGEKRMETEEGRGGWPDRREESLGRKEEEAEGECFGSCPWGRTQGEMHNNCGKRRGGEITAQKVVQELD
jgi:hypothetical protein